VLGFIARGEDIQEEEDTPSGEEGAPLVREREPSVREMAATFPHTPITRHMSK
jgi:hypothetical protein